MVKARGSKHGNACYFIRTLPWGDENDWLLKERLGWHQSDYQLCSETTKTFSIDINNIMPWHNVWLHLESPRLPDLLCKHWFTSSVWNFCCWGADVPRGETYLEGRSEEKRLFSQARISCEKNEFNHTLLKERLKSLDFRFLQPLIALLFETTTTSTTEETLKCGKHEIPEIFLVVLSLDRKQSLILFKSYRCSTQERSRAASE